MKITTGFLTLNLTGDDTGLDMPKTAECYAEKLRAAIQSEYPNAEIEIDWQNNAGGCLPQPLMTAVSGIGDYTAEQAIIGHVDRIAERVFDAGDFYVCA